MSKKPVLLLISLLVFFQTLKAQDISGIWEGGHSSPSTFYIMPIKIILELSLLNDSVITGISHIYYNKGRFEHHKLNGWFNKKEGKAYFSEDSIISFKKGVLQTIDAGKYTLFYSKSEVALHLVGKWTSKRKRLFIDPNISVSFHKKEAKKEEVVLSMIDSSGVSEKDKLSEAPRLDDVQMVIELDKKNMDSIRIDIYDNGEIDNDTISVLFNDREVLSRERITANPLTFFISLSGDNHFDKICLKAENMGLIPPNTALMTITTGKKKYTVLLNSSLEKNAVVEFFLKE